MSWAMKRRESSEVRVDSKKGYSHHHHPLGCPQVSGLMVGKGRLGQTNRLGSLLGP